MFRLGAAGDEPDGSARYSARRGAQYARHLGGTAEQALRPKLGRGAFLIRFPFGARHEKERQ